VDRWKRVFQLCVHRFADRVEPQSDRVEQKAEKGQCDWTANRWKGVIWGYFGTLQTGDWSTVPRVEGEKGEM